MQKEVSQKRKMQADHISKCGMNVAWQKTVLLHKPGARSSVHVAFLCWRAWRETVRSGGDCGEGKGAFLVQRGVEALLSVHTARTQALFAMSSDFSREAGNLAFYMKSGDFYNTLWTNLSMFMSVSSHIVTSSLCHPSMLFLENDIALAALICLHSWLDTRAGLPLCRHPRCPIGSQTGCRNPTSSLTSKGWGRELTCGEIAFPILTRLLAVLG